MSLPVVGWNLRPRMPDFSLIEVSWYVLGLVISGVSASVNAPRIAEWAAFSGSVLFPPMIWWSLPYPATVQVVAVEHHSSLACPSPKLCPSSCAATLHPPPKSGASPHGRSSASASSFPGTYAIPYQSHPRYSLGTYIQWSVGPDGP